MKHAAALLVALVAACDASALDSAAHLGPEDRPADAIDTTTPPGPPPPSGCVSLGEVAIYQAVKIPLARDGVAMARRNAEVVQARPALLRAFVRTAEDWQPAEVTARLTVRNGGSVTVVNDRRIISAASRDGDMESTFNFSLPPAAIGADTRWSVQVTGGCDARFPAADEAPLGARAGSVLKVRLVPLRYAADGSQRMPDLTDAQLTRYRELLRAQYPVTDVELTVREPLETAIDLSTRGWSDLLDWLRGVRARDQPAADVYYFGLVSPAATMTGYCKGTCVAGLAYRAPATSAGLRVGVGVGFTGEIAAQSLAHELGHQHGLGHAPCGSVAELDKSFPYPGGSTGAWGWDMRTGSLYDPAEHSDLMGYCRKSWVSDYTYRAMFERASRVGLPAAPGAIAQAVTVENGWRVAIAGAAGARWGAAWTDGVPENAIKAQATVRDASGAPLETIDVFGLPLDDGADPMWLVPQPHAGWASVDLPGAQRLPY